MSAGADSPRPYPALERSLLIHRRVFYTGMALLLGANIAFGSGWWTFWPMMVWAMAFGIHLCVVRSMNVDDDWAEARADDLLDKSYDFGHMRDISRRVVRRDESVQIPEEREG